MNRKRVILLCLMALLAAILVAILVLFYPGSKWAIGGPSTNDVYYYEDGAPPADPEIVGIWRNADNEGWYKVYYDDYDGDGFYWGKEWNEDEDVDEEDLTYHGNGWFRWRKEGKNQLKELHQMDISQAAIPKVWRYKTKPDSLMLFPYDSKNKKECDRFGRVLED